MKLTIEGQSQDSELVDVDLIQSLLDGRVLLVDSSGDVWAGDAILVMETHEVVSNEGSLIKDNTPFRVLPKDQRLVLSNEDV